VTLWDVRFQLPASAWQHPARACVDALALAAAPHARLGLTVPSGPTPPLLYIAAGRNEVGVGAGQVHIHIHILKHPRESPRTQPGP
jgi:hypothetical protein